MKTNDEFYIGWQSRAPAGVGLVIRRSVIAVLILACGMAGWLAFAQRTIGTSVFEWGTVKEFSGIFRARPYPHLLVSRPGETDPGKRFSSYHLVKPFKFGLEAALVARFDGRHVTMKGTLLYRGGQTMIEVVDNSIQERDVPSRDAAPLATADGERRSDALALGPVPLGHQTLAGEIVDSKCYLGVMNPGALIPHRACAIRCISGGIPPVLLVRRPEGAPLYFLLVSSDGQPVNRQVLDLVAEPVEIAGEVERHGEWFVLRADPATYRRLPN